MKRNLQQAAWAALAALVLLATGCETLHNASFVDTPADHAAGGGDNASWGGGA